MVSPKLSWDPSTHSFNATGTWTSTRISRIEKKLKKLTSSAESSDKNVHIDGKNINALDFSGAWLLYQFSLRLKKNKINVEFKNFHENHQKLFKLLEEKEKSIVKQAKFKPEDHSIVYRVGTFTVDNVIQVLEALDFLGRLTLHFLTLLAKPFKLRWRETFYAIEKNGYGALPIIALLSFLIGVVIAYQMGLQLKTYGTHIFIVNLTSLAVLREFGPLITAIILAGRTSAAFTAEIGTMKLGEEIDALEVMGLSPFTYLVVPKILALLISVPLLIVWADIFGCFGSMVMSKSILSLTYYDFITRFQQVTSLTTFLIGLMKAPVFAAIISFVGCYQGLQVGGTADSVGRQTTRTVVQVIFLIIVADAFFSILLSWKGI